MPLDTAVKKEILAEYATSEGDTGSPEVQVALLTRRSRRRRLLKYLAKRDINRYREVIARLGIRR
ncbi:MAG: 30S ribosomal protein S15 [Streptosporangiaceae bacterium]